MRTLRPRETEGSEHLPQQSPAFFQGLVTHRPGTSPAPAPDLHSWSLSAASPRAFKGHRVVLTCSLKPLPARHTSPFPSDTCSRAGSVPDGHTPQQQAAELSTIFLILPASEHLKVRESIFLSVLHSTSIGPCT